MACLLFNTQQNYAGASYGHATVTASGSDIALSLYCILSFSKRTAVESDILLCWFRCFLVALNGAFSAWGDLVLGVEVERFVGSDHVDGAPAARPFVRPLALGLQR